MANINNPVVVVASGRETKYKHLIISELEKYTQGTTSIGTVIFELVLDTNTEITTPTELLNVLNGKTVQARGVYNEYSSYPPSYAGKEVLAVTAKIHAADNRSYIGYLSADTYAGDVYSAAFFLDDLYSFEITDYVEEITV